MGAEFTISDTEFDTLGYDATHDEVLDLALEDSTGLDAPRVVYSVVASSDGAPALTFSPSTGIPTTPTGVVTVTMPSTGVHSWRIQCQINEGRDSTGRTNREYTKERIVAIRSSNLELRKLVPGETTQYSSTGWTEEQNTAVDAIEAGAGGGGLTLVETYPTAAGEFYVDANGELWGFSTRQGIASPVMYELDNALITDDRLDTPTTTLAERVISDGVIAPAVTIFAYYIPEDDLVADIDDYAIISIWSRPVVGGARVLQLEMRTTPIVGGDVNATGNWTAFRPVTFGTAGGSYAVPAGSVLTWDIVPSNAGAPVPTGKIFVQAIRTAAFPPGS
jgi:hypothetical protein